MLVTLLNSSSPSDNLDKSFGKSYQYTFWILDKKLQFVSDVHLVEVL